MLDQAEQIAERSPTKLGEELPVFCERCGYSLHGLAQIRCEHCTLLQFHCPECGHHQPINTLRPAAQTILGRIRGGWLTLIILFKLNLFGWLLFAWVAMGHEWSYRVDYASNQNRTVVWKPAPITGDSFLAFSLFAIPCGIVLRMALLRWRRGWVVGIVIASMVMAAIALGAWMWQLERSYVIPWGFTSDFLTLMLITFLLIVLAATIAWPLWTLLVHAFLPKQTAHHLLEWQRSLSNRVSGLSRPDASPIARHGAQ